MEYWNMLSTPMKYYVGTSYVIGGVVAGGFLVLASSGFDSGRPTPLDATTIGLASGVFVASPLVAPAVVLLVGSQVVGMIGR